jgi:hypothetical protein
MTDVLACSFTVPQSIRFIFAIVLGESDAATTVKRKVKLSLCTTGRCTEGARYSSTHFELWDVT